MRDGIPAKWRSGIKKCLAQTKQESRIPGEVERFLEILIGVAVETDWLGYRAALGDLELPRGYSHVRVASGGRPLPDAQIYARHGGRVEPVSVLDAATCNGRRKIVQICQTVLPGNEAGVLDLDVTLSPGVVRGPPRAAAGGTTPSQQDCFS
jgi:hypothetical protein